MESPNSADKNKCTEAENAASIRSAADNDKAQNTKDTHKTQGVDKGAKPQKANPSKKGPKAKPTGMKGTDRFDSFEIILKQMHQESREHKKAISDRLDKLEQDYSQMNMYLNDSGSHGQYDDGNEYQNQADPYGHGPGPSNESYDDSNANDHDDAVSDTAESAGQSVTNCIAKIRS